MSSVFNSPSRPVRRPADAPTFVLVRGSGSNSFMWAPVQRELALRGHRSYAVDLPGHGLDAQYPVVYQAQQDLEAWAKRPSTLAGVTLQDNIDTVIGADTWGTISRTYIRLTEDRTLPVAMQDRLITEADALTPDNPYDVHSLDTSHVGFVLRAAEVAAILDQASR